MESARKMVLVPVETMQKCQQLLEGQTHSLALGGKTLRKANTDRLENEMDQTLAWPDLDDSDKWLRNRQALLGFTTAARSVGQPPAPAVAKDDVVGSPLLRAIALQYVPSNARGLGYNV